MIPGKFSVKNISDEEREVTLNGKYTINKDHKYF